MNYRYPAKPKFVSPKLVALVKLRLVFMIKKFPVEHNQKLKPEPNYRQVTFD